jgi:hypothetical protein
MPLGSADFPPCMENVDSVDSADSWVAIVAGRKKSANRPK